MIFADTGMSDDKKIKRCIKKFLRIFPKGFQDQKYKDWERNYKWDAHLHWEEHLGKEKFEDLLDAENFKRIATLAVRTESRTNLLFSFEKMALRDAVKSQDGARSFSNGLYNYIYGEDPLEARFEKFASTLSLLPRKQTRVRTWPLQTVFGFIANPKEHIFLKPRVTQLAAEAWGYDLKYASRPNWETYKSLLDFTKEIKKEIKPMKPKDMIDLQSFIFVIGWEGYG